jgi:hypothetical protein
MMFLSLRHATLDELPLPWEIASVSLRQTQPVTTMESSPPDQAATVRRKTLPELQKDLEDRYKFHLENAEKAVKRFKPLSLGFGLAIPLLAAFVSFAMSPDSLISRTVATYLGLALTLLTICNSVLKPAERFSKAVELTIDLHEWKLDAGISITEADETKVEDFHNLIRKLDEKLSKIGKAMASGWNPKQPE